MAAGDVWGNSWGDAWGASWRTAVAPTNTLHGRRRRRRRRPLWSLQDGERKIDPVVLREEAQYIEALARERELYELLDEQRVLRAAIEVATRQQQRTISALIADIERRVDEIEDDEAALLLLT